MPAPFAAVVTTGISCCAGCPVSQQRRNTRPYPFAAAAEAAGFRPGLRVPGAVDPLEVAVRAVLGQQVAPDRATALAGRLVAAYGRPGRGLARLTAALRAVPGVGPWTAASVAMRGFGERDAFPAGDLGIRRARRRHRRRGGGRGLRMDPWRA